MDFHHVSKGFVVSFQEQLLFWALTVFDHMKYPYSSPFTYSINGFSERYVIAQYSRESCYYKNFCVL